MTATPDTSRAAHRLRYQLLKSGLSIGHVGTELAEMDKQALDALLDEAARTGQTLAKVLVTRWSGEGHRRASG